LPSGTQEQGAGRAGREGGDTFQPVRSRLRPAQAHMRLVRRKGLVAALQRRYEPLVVLSAPAGYGKSTVLAQWAAAQRRPTAWLQLDEADNDPIVLLSYLAVALEVVAPVSAGLVDLLQRRYPPVQERVLPALATALASAPPFLLVLDDGHLLNSDDGWRHVRFVLEQLPLGAQLAIGSRREPGLPLARLRAAGRLAEFHAQELAMGRAEVREMLRLQGMAEDEAMLDVLLATTEGWPTGLYLALLAGRAHDAGARLAQVRGDRREIAAYLGAEVLDRQPDEVRRFLLHTSLVDELSAPLCDAMTRGGGGAEVLARLARENLFVAALDGHDEWFRYHHLFRGLLQAELERREPERVTELHQRAAAWYDAHDRWDLAVRHSLAAGDVDAAVRPAFIGCWEYVDRGQAETARLMMDRFTDGQLTSSVALTLAAGYLYGTVLDDRRRGERWRRIACSAEVGDEPLPVGGTGARSLQLGLRAFLAPNGVKAMLHDAELALEAASASGSDRSEPSRVLGVAAYLSGQHGRARRSFDAVANECGEYSLEAYAWGFLALIAADEGRWEDATESDARVAELSPTMTLDLSPGMFLALPMLLARTRVRAHAGDPQTADWRARTATYLEDMVPQVPWRIMLVSVVLGEIALDLEEVSEAERWAARAERSLRDCPDAGMLRGRIERLRQALEERRLADPLTAAERRVLALLPTQLTAEQMATRLFLSRNTVKTHMRRLYLKLGVSTRTEAVERARGLRLLPHDAER
jgi:ATP/maltotriose-dependent transcriptional regulator MalT